MKNMRNKIQKREKLLRQISDRKNNLLKVSGECDCLIVR